jgi:precorrin-2 dehydrogenase / sirohydrochlorin ferrochelatase
MTAARPNPLFQVGLDVQGRVCLVIGGGVEAQDKTGRLLDAGADVLLVSPGLTPALESLVKGGNLRARRRSYRPWDLDGVFLVMNTVRDSDLAERVFLAAESRGTLVNTYDDLVHSHFGMAALVCAGPLRVSISSSNASPTLSGQLRQDLEGMFDAEFGEFVEELGRARVQLKERIPDFATRRLVLRGLVEGFSLQGHVQLPGDWRRRIERALTEASETGQKKTR